MTVDSAVHVPGAWRNEPRRHDLASAPPLPARLCTPRISS